MKIFSVLIMGIVLMCGALLYTYLTRVPHNSSANSKQLLVLKAAITTYRDFNRQEYPPSLDVLVQDEFCTAEQLQHSLTKDNILYKMPKKGIDEAQPLLWFPKSVFIPKDLYPVLYDDGTVRMFSTYHVITSD